MTADELIGVIPFPRSHKTDGDYIGDGQLLYCGKCHTPKETVIFNEKIVPCLCDCAIKERDAEDAASKRKQEIIRASNLKQACFNHSQKLLTQTFENDNGKQPKISIAKAYCDNWDINRRNNVGLIFVGDVGTGKSYAAACIANELCGKGIPVRMLNLSEALNGITATFAKEEYISHLASFPLLIIDDFGIQRSTEYAVEQTFNIIDSRTRSGKPMVITTNIPISVMREEADMTMKRIYDRILEVCTPVSFEGESMRPDNQKDKRRILEGILNGSQKTDGITAAR